MHKIPHTFVSYDCIVFRLYAKLLSTHGPCLTYCAIFLNKLVNLYIFQKKLNVYLFCYEDASRMSSRADFKFYLYN